MKWKRANQGPIEEPLVDYLKALFKVEMDRGYDLKVCIGTDSQKAGKGYKFATAIVITTREHMGIEYKKKANGDKVPVDVWAGRGAMVIGGTFWEEMKASTNKKKHREIEVLNERMFKEVSASINAGYEVWPLLDEMGIPLEIHGDINADPQHESNASLQQAVGYITAMGWDAKIKPEAWAASKAADRVCRK